MNRTDARVFGEIPVQSLPQATEYTLSIFLERVRQR